MMAPGYARAWALLTIAPRSLKFAGRSTETGLAAAERAVALDLALAEAHAARGRVLLDAGRYDEATAEIADALRLDGDSYEVNRTAGKLSYRLTHLDDAIRYYEKAMTLMETDVHAAAMLASCYVGVGDHPAAVRCAEITFARAAKMLAQDPHNSAVIAEGSNALALLGRPSERRNGSAARCCSIRAT
jgi:adenylate cyclase